MSRRTKRAFFYAAQNGKCAYCSVQMTMKLNRPNTCTIDHIIPRAQKGATTMFNLIGACSDCNTRKADKPLILFLMEREQQAPELPLRQTAEVYCLNTARKLRGNQLSKN